MLIILSLTQHCVPDDDPVGLYSALTIHSFHLAAADIVYILEMKGLGM